jgi:hypothetical protein
MRAAPQYHANIVYRKTSRPPVIYSDDIQVVTERCRINGGEEDAIALLADIFSTQISEGALTRKMTREEAHTHLGSASTQVYRMILRGDGAGRFHCRLCAVGANEGGWKRPRDALRHLKRDHFGLGEACMLWLVHNQCIYMYP